MAHNDHAAVYMSNLRSDMRIGDLKNFILSLFSKTLSVKINKSNINVITSTGNYSAIIDVRDEDDMEHILQHLSTFESRKKLAFNFMNIVPSGQMLDIKRFKLADEEQAKERLPDIYERRIADYGSNLSKFYIIGEKLGNETRNTEFKKAGGRYMETEMRKDVPNYLCGFLNSEVRGTLMFGVLDDGTVVGVECSQNQEDRYRLDIDCAIKEIEPKLFPQHYKVEFVQVVEKTLTLKALSGTRLIRRLQRINNMAHNDHAAVYMSNLRSDMRIGDLKNFILSLFSKTLSVKINKSNINVITSTGNYSAIIDVRDEDDMEHILQHLSTFESRKKLAFNFMNIVPSGQMLDIKRFKLADEEQAKERLPDIYERRIADYGSNLSKFYVIGEKLGNETRNTEFKKAGGRYMETEMRKDVPNYLCGFLNSEVRGTLMFGVLDDGTVVGVECSQNQEDRYRLDIDCAIKEIEPKLFPQHYKVEFVQVVEKTLTLKEPRLTNFMPPTPSSLASTDILNDYLKSGAERTGALKTHCKVIEVTVEIPSDQFKLYKTKDGVFVRRDGSLQVITAWSDLQELTHLKHRDGVNQLHAEFRMQLEKKERTIETQAETIQHQQHDLQQYRAMQQSKSKICIIS